MCMGFWNYITGEDLEDAQARSDAADAGNAKRNADLLDRGIWTRKQYDEAQARLYAGRIDAEQEVEDAFLEELGDGYDSLTGAIKTTLNAPFKFAFDAIPGWFWIVGAGAAFFYLGGSVKGVIKK